MLPPKSAGCDKTIEYVDPCSNFISPDGVRSKCTTPTGLCSEAFKNPCTQVSAVGGLANSKLILYKRSENKADIKINRFFKTIVRNNYGKMEILFQCL